MLSSIRMIYLSLAQKIELYVEYMFALVCFHDFDCCTRFKCLILRRSNGDLAVN